MKLYSKEGIKIPVIKTKRPSFKANFGRTWDSSPINIDDVPVNMHLDTTWGQYLYFQYGIENQWYKIKMWSDPINDLIGKGSYDIDPFDSKTILKTKPI